MIPLLHFTPVLPAPAGHGQMGVQVVQEPFKHLGLDLLVLIPAQILRR